MTTEGKSCNQTRLSKKKNKALFAPIEKPSFPLSLPVTPRAHPAVLGPDSTAVGPARAGGHHVLQVRSPAPPPASPAKQER